MAIYHMSAQVIGRSTGRSATAAAAYRAAEKIADERTGEIHDYTRKDGVDYREILTPDNAPSWTADRAELWNRVEQSEKRKDAQLAREINIAIPKELDSQQGRELVRGYAQKNFVSQGMIADICIHHENRENPHAHIMLSMRELGADNFGKKVREWNDKEQLEKWREEWAHSCNIALEKAGELCRVDHRSLSAQGIDRGATKHLGPVSSGMEKRGEPSEKGDYNRDIEELARLQKALAQVTKELETVHKEKEAHEASVSSAIEISKPAEKTPQSIVGILNKQQEQKAESKQAQVASIAAVINKPKQQEKTQEQISFEQMLSVIKNGNQGQANIIINRLRENAQDKDLKIIAESKPEAISYKQNIVQAQKALEFAQRQERAIASEKEELGMLAKLQYKAGKHELNTAEIATQKAKEKANLELTKNKREFDEYLFRETNPGGITFEECREHNQFIAPKAREALPIAEKAYSERIKEEQNRERERMRGRAREPERGRGR